MIKNLNLKMSIACLIIITLFVFYLFGWTGARTVLGMFAVFFLPFYLILDNFNIEQDEKVFFSFFIGLALYSVFVFYVNRIIPSMRVSMVVTFVVLIIVGVVIRYSKHKKSKTQMAS